MFVGPPSKKEALHYISSIFQQISFHDDVCLVKSTHDCHTVSFVGQDVPQDNTCMRVLDVLSDRLANFWDIQVTKRIPAGSGLGGGSSNAATLLRALNRQEKLQLSMDQMVNIAKNIGSDIPFFLYGGQCHVSGYGETIVPNVSYICCPYYVLILPGIHMSTARVYTMLDKMNQFDDLSTLSESSFQDMGVNRLTDAARRVSKPLSELYVYIVNYISDTVFMTGSGSTLVIPCYSLDERRQMTDALREQLPNDTGVHPVEAMR